MRIEAFRLLSLNQQIKETCQSGGFLFIRKEPGLDVALYHLHGFYVEIYLDPGKHGKTKLRCFESTDELLPYYNLNDIATIRDLVKRKK